MNNINMITEIFCDLLEGAMLLFSYIALSGKRDFIKENKAKSIVFVLMYGFFCFWAFTNIPGGLHTFVLVVFAVLLLYSVTKSSLYISFATVIITFLILAVAEVLWIAAAAPVLRIEFAEMLTSPRVRLVSVISTKILQCGIIALLYYKKIRIFKENINEKDSKIITYPLSQGGFALFAVFVPQYFLKGQNTATGVIMLIIFLLFLVFLYFDYKDREKMLNIQNKYLAQTEYVRNMETVVDVIRKEKHDFGNHLNTIMAICQLNREDALEKIEAYISNLTGALGSSYKFYNTGNNYIDGLLAVKSNKAFENNIILEVDFEAPLSLVNADDITLTSITGNIIDNAFDAVRLNPHGGKRVVSVYSYCENDKYFMSISNNGPQISENDLEKIFENGYTTKPGNCENEHGYGLYITRQLVEKVSGNISVYSTEENTEFLIEFQVKSEAVAGGVAADSNSRKAS